MRQRYYDAATGRFNRLDPFFGNVNDPQSLHKYLYTHADPVNGVAPSGEMTLGSMMSSIGNIGTMVVNNARTAFQVYQFIQKVQTVIEMMQLMAALTTGFPAIQQEILREIKSAINIDNASKRFRSITSQDIFDVLEQLAVDIPTTIAQLIASKHSSRFAHALSSRHLPLSRRDVIVLYMPSIEGHIQESI